MSFQPVIARRAERSWPGCAGGRSPHHFPRRVGIAVVNVDSAMLRQRREGAPPSRRRTVWRRRIGGCPTAATLLSPWALGQAPPFDPHTDSRRQLELGDAPASRRRRRVRPPHRAGEVVVVITPARKNLSSIATGIIRPQKSRTGEPSGRWIVKALRLTARTARRKAHRGCC